MRILFIGDISGRPGRKIIELYLGKLIQAKQIDFVIANGENAAAGAGINQNILQELANYGIDVFTTGNHVWDNKDVLNFIGKDQRILRPANLPEVCPGLGYQLYTVGAVTVAVINLIGRVFIQYPMGDDPFAKASQILKVIRQQTKHIIVDFHAEATSEKMALGWYLDGQVSAVIGTHTHIQTNDARVLRRGTAYITDVGMTGARDSILGLEIDGILERFTRQMPVKSIIADGDLQFNGLLLDLDAQGKAQSLETLNIVHSSL